MNDAAQYAHSRCFLKDLFTVLYDDMQMRMGVQKRKHGRTESASDIDYYTLFRKCGPIKAYAYA